METKANAKGEEIFYVPICREYGCNGNLIISINEYLFQVNCFCEKNHNHKYKLYFDTFDKFYLKEKIIKRCSYCFNKIVNEKSIIIVTNATNYIVQIVSYMISI